MNGRILVFSDTHLTAKYNPMKFELLAKLISQSDRVIINGDFYEGYIINFAQFVASPWQKLFSLLKEKRAVYIAGNHDKLFSGQNYGMFCDQAVEKFDFEQKGVQFHIFHGHGVDRTFDVRHPNFPRLIVGVISRVEKLVARTFGRRYLALYQRENDILKNWKARHLPADEWLICGHTHLAELDEKVKFANSGLFLSSQLASYLTIENGKINLHYIDFFHNQLRRQK